MERESLQIEIQSIKTNSKFLSSVKSLWRDNSATLGYFPDGAFLDYAHRGQILIATDHLNDCIGYILYRISRGSIIIVHLCIHTAYRGYGIARALIDELKRLTKDFEGIGLSCRRDFEIHSMWPKLGFKPIKERPGRSLAGTMLTFWWFDHNHPTLFTSALEDDLDNYVCAAIDANVFYDIDATEDPHSQESKALVADWISNSLKLYLTPEIYNEIDRNPQQDQRERQRARIHHFEVLPSPPEAYEILEHEIISLFPEPPSEQDKSDCRQLSHAIAAEVPIFITRDKYILDLSSLIFEKYDLAIMRPSDTITHIDNLQRKDDYQPASLASTEIERARTVTIDETFLVSTFLNNKEGERKPDFLSKLRTLRSDTKNSEVNLVRNHLKELLSIFALSLTDDSKLLIALLRTKPGKLSGTLTRYLCEYAVRVSSNRSIFTTRIDDMFHSPVPKISELGFVSTNGVLIKLNYYGLNTALEIQNWLSSLKLNATPQEEIVRKEVLGLLTNYTNNNDILTAYQLENLLWPCKLRSSSIPTFIIPIRPAWARDLFDEELAAGELFPAKVNLALNHEGIYYRSASLSGLIAPSRILWYVSQNKNFPGSGCIRACSRLDSFEIDTPKFLFRQFKNLGIYEWRDVLEQADGDLSKNIMAIKFSRTELFSNPVTWTDAQMILAREGKKSQFQSPLKISDTIFETLYTLGHK
jgi:GNAT superfamily N-acetyltransferase